MARRGVRSTEDGIKVEEVPDLPDNDWLRLQVASVGICATDLWLIDQGPLPFVLGHEFAGRLDDGTAVVVNPLLRCGECDQCAKGEYQRCRKVVEGAIGSGADGGMSDEVLVPDYSVSRLPEEVSLGDASLIEPLAVAVHAMDRIEGEPGRRVAVVGGGSLGLMVAAVAADAGCEVSIAARHDHQLAAAEKLGVGTAVSGEYDVVIDAAGSESGLVRCAELLAPGGVLELLSFYDPAGVNFPAVPLLLKEATVVTSTAYCSGHGQEDFDRAAGFLARHPEVSEALITNRFALDDAPAAFAAARDRAGGSIKVVVEP